MRKLADLRTRGIKRCSVESETCRSLPKIQVASDVVYCLSRYDKRLKTFYRCKNFNSNRMSNILVPWRKSYERKVCYEGKAAFDVDLCPFINLESLRVVDSRMFDLSVINGIGIRRLELSRIPRLLISNGLMDISLQEISLNDQSIFYKDLKGILGIPSLMSISLDNVEVLGSLDWKSQLLGDLRRIPKLREVRMVNMKIELQSFGELCCSKDLARFLISDASVHAEARLNSSFASILKFQNSLESFSFLDLGAAELIHIKGTDIRYTMGMSLPHLRSLCVEQVVIDSNTFRNLYLRQPCLVELGFIECVFDHVSFYEIITHFRESLTHLDLRSSNLPHDYVSFLQNKLIFCFVILKNGELMVVNNIGDTRKRIRTNI